MSDLRLNAHEKAAIANAAKNYADHPAALWEAVHAAIDPREEAAYRRALEDAAENVDLSAHFDPSPSGRVSIACTDAERKVKVWLRDRAAGVGTKDGDDE